MNPTTEAPAEVSREALLGMLGSTPVSELAFTDAPAPNAAAVTVEVDKTNPPADPEKAALMAALEASKSLNDEMPAVEEKTSTDKANEPAKPGESTEAKPAEVTLSKEEIAAEMTRLKQEAESLAKQRADYEKLVKESTSEVARMQRTAKDYLEFATEWEAEGKTELAAKAREQAAKLERDASQLAKTASETVQQADFDRRQKAAMAQVLAQNPELKDPDSPLAKEIFDVLKKYPLLQREPDGILYATEAAKLTRRAARVEVLEKELAETKQRLDDREKLLQPGTGDPSSASVGGGFENLPPEQQRAALVEALRGADQAGVNSFGR